jgi:hypothetical protein
VHIAANDDGDSGGDAAGGGDNQSRGDGAIHQVHSIRCIDVLEIPDVPGSDMTQAEKPPAVR